jgi:hypothetical protein
MEKSLTKQQILEEKQLLNENWIENSLMVAGFVPVIGEVADFALILYYCYKKQWLYAGLMLIALIPTVGDFIAKPIIKIFKSPVAKGALKSTDELVAFLKANPKVMEQYVKLGKEVNNPALKTAISQVRGISPTFARKLETALVEQKSVFAKLMEKPKGIVNAIGHEGKIGGGLTRFFKEEKLYDYIIKKGELPSSWLSKWWNITYKGNRAKRQYIKNFIAANNLLKFLGIASLSDLERKMEDPKELEKLSRNPEFSRMVNSTTSEGDLSQIESSEESAGELSNGSMNLGMGLNILKGLAQKYV